MLVELIEALHNDIGTGLNEATIRTRLSLIREQAEAVETEIEQAKARIKELETKLQTQKLSPHQGTLEDDSKKMQMLVLLFHAEGTHGGITIPQIAKRLGVSNGIAQYHADTLSGAKPPLIELVAGGPLGLVYILTAEGRAYVVENKLA